MLNEIAEFESYVKDPASRNPRIQPKLFTENFSNSCSLYELDQILLVIARGFIFSAYRNKDFWDSNGILNQEILTNTTTVLMRWCGFVPQNTNNFSHPDNPVRKWFQDYPDADGWLERYWKSHCPKPECEKNQLWEQVVQKRSGILSALDYKGNISTYHSIIALALSQGALKERYLIFKKDDSFTKEKSNAGKRFTYLYQLIPGKDGRIHNLQPKTQERLLKTIVAYLLSKEYHPKGQSSILLKRLRLLNWYSADDAKNDRSIWYYPTCVWKIEPLIPIMEATDPKEHLSFIKLKINQEFLEHFDFHIVEKEQLCDVDREKYWILEDTGHGTGSLKCME